MEPEGANELEHEGDQLLEPEGAQEQEPEGTHEQEVNVPDSPQQPANDGTATTRSSNPKADYTSDCRQNPHQPPSVASGCRGPIFNQCGQSFACFSILQGFHRSRTVGFRDSSLPHPMSLDQGASNSERSVAAHQRGMEESLNIAKNKDLDYKRESFFYGANIPFNVARNSVVIDVVKATSRTRFDYAPPSYYKLRTNLLEPRRLQV